MAKFDSSNENFQNENGYNSPFFSKKKEENKILKKYEYRDQNGSVHALVEKQIDRNNKESLLTFRYIVKKNNSKELVNLTDQKYKEMNFIYNYDEISKGLKTSSLQSILIFQYEESCDFFQVHLSKYSPHIIPTTFFHDLKFLSKQSLKVLREIPQKVKIFLVSSQFQTDEMFKNSLMKVKDSELEITIIDVADLGISPREDVSLLLKNSKSFGDELINFINKKIGYVKQKRNTELEIYESTIGKYKEFTDEYYYSKFKYLYSGNYIFCPEISDQNWLVWDKDKGIWVQDKRNRIIDSFINEIDSDFDSKISSEKNELRKKELITAKRRFNNNQKSNKLLNYFKNRSDFKGDINDFNSNKNLLPCKNGITIDLSGDNIKTKVSNPYDFFTGSIEADYDENAKCPNWQEFIQSCHPDEEVQRLIQEICGSALTGEKNFQKIFVNLGEGANGKSIFIRVITYFFGNFSVTGDKSISQMSKGNMDSVARLHKARIITTHELSKDIKMNESILKNLSGNDKIVGKKLFKDSFEFSPEATIILNGNYIPEYDTDSLAMKRRLVFIPWEQKFLEGTEKYIPTEILLNNLQKEYSGILNWCLEGWRRLKSNHWKFTNPINVSDKMRSILTSKDIVNHFINECLEYIPIDNQKRIKSQARNRSKIYEYYYKFCEKNSYKPLVEKEFVEVILKSKISNDDGDVFILEYKEKGDIKGYINIKRKE